MISALRIGARRMAVPARSAVVASRGLSTGIPQDKDQATGLRKEELEEELKGNIRFNRNALFVEKFGTKADPTLIPSMNSSRVVGCSGGCTEVSRFERTTIPASRI